jgi:aminopeptidase N
LFALVAGQLEARRDEFVTRSGRRVVLAIWTAAGDVPRSAHAMAALKASMAWDERVYGLEYDLDEFNIVAVADFNAGAMENKGLNIFNSKYVLADAETATDADFDAVAAVVAHEYFHNWTGNRVTCRDWFQLSLKEGLTVFRDQQFSADQGSAAVRRIDDVRSLRAVQFPEDAGPLAHPIRPDHYAEIANFYTATIYNKGAEVIRMLHTLLGAAGFRKGADLYFERHDGQAVTCEDWLAAMEDANGRDLKQFRRWYDQAGTPRIGVHVARAGRQMTVALTQRLGESGPEAVGTPARPMMHIPFRLALIGKESGRRIGAERLVELKERETRLVFEGLEEPVLLSLNRGFSAPVILEARAARAELAFLAAHDDDPFARWEAMQRLALDVLATDDAADELVAAVAATLEASELDPAFVAEAVLLPSEAFIGDQAVTVEVEAIHRRREAARLAIARALEPQWWTLWRRHGASGTALTPEAKGARRLANVALGYVVAAASADGVRAAAEQYAGAQTMTDRLGALNALINTDSEARDAALADFEKRFAGNHDVIDKWFTVQALASRADTLARVTALIGHKDFTIGNPNRLRALVGAFAANQKHFHAADGSGYALLTEQLLAVDRINPQSAARLTVPLGRWRRFDGARQALMCAALQRIVATPGVSRDVLEMASRALG